jgi:hypothetical protein
MRAWGARLGGRRLAVALAALTLTSCAGGDFSFYVKNSTASTWYLETPRSGDSGDMWVVKVDPGADTFALSWSRKSSGTVTVLALDCTVVGVFRATGDGSWVVDAVPGLTGRVEANGGPPGSRTTTPGVIDSTQCGGTLLG